MSAPRRDIGRYTGPALIASVGLVMLYWSWGTWPDPLVDFGAQLYVPWQISTGHVLYRDVAYYSGPFSSYFNALMFIVFGVGLRTLVWVNICILAATVIIAYRLTAHCSSRLAATVGGVTFLLVFAFGQVVGVGNFNWITPYTHEVCHGTAMGIAAIACLRRFQDQGKKVWLISTGLLLGLVVLTKAEPTVAAFAAAFALLIGGWWVNRASRKTICSSLSILIGCTLVTPVVATALLSLAMPWTRAIVSEIGSWPWTFDHRIASLHFYRAVAGLDDVPGNLKILLHWSGIYILLLITGLVGAFMTRSKAKSMATALILFVLICGWAAFQFDSINWSGMLTPLPILLLIALVMAAASVFRRTNPTAPLQLSLVVFSLALLSKMGLTARPFHYGFVLAWPGTMVLICICVQHLPKLIEKYGGNPKPILSVSAASWLIAVTVLLQRDAQNFSSKTLLVAKGTVDEFWGNARGMEVSQVCAGVREIVPKGGTVEVLPQGLMVNYLTRLPSPTRFTNFMPPEVISVGEDTILTALKTHPPDAVVLTMSSIKDGSFTMDEKDPYGARTLAWVQHNYRVVQKVELPEPLQAAYGFVILVKR